MSFIRKSTVMFFCLLLLFSCGREDDCLVRVDKAIGMRAGFDLAHRERVDSVESLLSSCVSESSRFGLYGEIFELFKCNDIDSASFYAQKMADIRDDVHSRAAIATVLSARRSYARAFECLDGISREGLTDRELLVLYDTYQSICSAANNESGLEESERELYVERKIQYQKETLLLTDLTPFERLYYRGRLLASQGRWQESVDVLDEALLLNPPPQIALHCTYCMAGSMKELGRMDGYLEKLCETAILDFSTSNKQYVSLYKIALHLYAKGDYKRAGDYIQTTIIDAIQCNYSTRIVNAVDAQHIITVARLQRERRLKYALFSGILLLVAFCMVSFWLYLRIKRKSRQVKAVNDRVKELNRELKNLNDCLQEEGTIKDRCLFRYMTLTVRFIDNIEDYRRLLRKTLKEEGIDSLKEKLSQQEYLYMQYDTFYKLFDEIFISIFPDFVDRVNSLLPEGQKYELKRDGSFPTELRILAVIRLGITKSSRIAEFLNCPVGSVYTNKANLKIKLGCGEKPLEDLLLGL